MQSAAVAATLTARKQEEEEEKEDATAAVVGHVRSEAEDLEARCWEADLRCRSFAGG